MAKTLDITQALTEAIAKARATCDEKGNNSNECALAWETVEELRVEKSHQQETAKSKTALERYCETHPEASECRIYDV